eukprot:ANDGO_07389.mRNA.1 hypothetical protein
MLKFLKKPKRTESDQSATQSSSGPGDVPDVVRCPICDAHVFSLFLNDHIDSGCTLHCSAHSNASKKRDAPSVSSAKSAPSPSVEALSDPIACGGSCSSPSVFDVLSPKTSDSFVRKRRRAQADVPYMQGHFVLTRTAELGYRVVFFKSFDEAKRDFRDETISSFGKSGDCHFYSCFPNPGPTGAGNSREASELVHPSVVGPSPPLPLLKSVLQKAIRRGKAAVAMRIAMHMMRSHCVDFLRRLCIIIVEDVMLHPSYDVLVWMMCASTIAQTLKGDCVWSPLPYDFEFVCRVVFQLCAVEQRDPIPWGVESANVHPFTNDDLVSLEPSASILIQSLLIRSEFGGMGGDIVLLRNAAKKWFARFKTQSGMKRLLEIFAEVGVRHLKPERFSVLTVANIGDDIEVWKVGVDHHVSRVAEVVVEHLRSDVAFCSLCAGADMLSIVGSAIWEFRSSVNFRSKSFENEPLDTKTSDAAAPTLERIWALIEAEVDRFAHQYVMKKTPGTTS